MTTTDGMRDRIRMALGELGATWEDPEVVVESLSALVAEARRETEINTLSHWARFFDDPSMNAMTPAERLRSEIDRLSSVGGEES